MRIGEPEMLLWLIDAAGLGVHLPAAARTPRQTPGDMRKQAALIRERVPWAVVARALGLPADDKTVKPGRQPRERFAK